MADSLKLLELQDQVWPARWDALVKTLASDHGLELKAEVRKASAEDFSQRLTEALTEDWDLIRICDNLSGFVESAMPQTTYTVSHFHAAGLVMRKQNKWWPHSLFDESLMRSLAEKIGHLDLTAMALVVGAESSSKIIAGALVRMGFRSICLIDRQVELAKRTAAQLREHFFGVSFTHIDGGELTTLPGNCSIVINTTPLVLENDLLEELYFFNFLKAGGAVVDLTLIPTETPLMVEAKQWGARLLSGGIIAADRDSYMIELATGKKLDILKYRTALQQNIDAVPFDSTPFLNKFRDREV